MTNFLIAALALFLAVLFLCATVVRMMLEGLTGLIPVLPL